MLEMLTALLIHTRTHNKPLSVCVCVSLSDLGVGILSNDSLAESIVAEIAPHLQRQQFVFAPLKRHFILCARGCRYVLAFGFSESLGLGLVDWG